KAYQISQYDLPFSENGWLDVDVPTGKNFDPVTKRVRIIRAHLEEDAGKNIHDESGGGGESRVDLNRCGTPLVEIVSEPDIRSAQEAKAYLEELRLLLTYLGVSDCNMQEGSLRCDANVNLQFPGENGETIATPIVEVKNLNSFRGVEAAVEFEAKRQWDLYQKTKIKLGDPGGQKETRGWNADRNYTFEQRGKEEASDYRYFPDPDLVPVTVTPERIESVKESLCEFPAPRRQRFRETWQLSAYDAAVIIDQGQSFADYFESVANSCGDGKQAANWVTQDVQRELNDRQIPIEEFPIGAEVLGALLKCVTDGEITVKSGREVFTVLLEEADNGKSPTPKRIAEIIEEKDLKVVSDTGALDGVISTVIARNQKAVEDFQSGKQAAVGALIGQVMREVKGADAKVVRQMLIDRMSQ
ncbi:MAG: Asp-tRNA(Asn)/Glu-tRNA(Gln) amidotransferase subunit GatB, partial [Planctomycetaceae bacterium]|nr:Asp-tRNA(Asn)/Glu-tRNA(Gln) amidotransferase subunit GatB [Planctomycetaceae bacterium]